MVDNAIGPKSKKQHQFVESDAAVTVFGGAAGAGKALRHGTPVLTTDGWVNIEDMEVGMTLPTPHDGTQSVLAVYPQGVVDLYRVTFEDGAWIDVCGEHLWKVRSDHDSMSRVVNTKTILDNIDLLDYYTDLCYGYFDTQDAIVNDHLLKKIVPNFAIDCHGDLVYLHGTVTEDVKMDVRKIGGFVDKDNKLRHPALLGIKSTKYIQIVSVTPIGRDKATCIAISGEDKQFITKDYLVTHNSYLGVMNFLKYIHHPKFRGVIIRRTTPQLTGPGGILDNALDLFKRVEPRVRWRAKDGKFVFPSGAEVFLRHFESVKDKQNFDGWEVNYFLLDEGQQFEEEMVSYLFSRMRNPKCPEVKPMMKITCNPESGSFLKKWIEWYLDPDTGLPIPERSGVTRWFVKEGRTLKWADTWDEAIELYGKKDLAKDHENQVKPISLKFISANVYDNPVVCKENPEYVGWLESLEKVEKERLLYGSWNAKPEGSGCFKREWTPEVLLPAERASRVRAWDLAGTLPSDVNKNPDYTVGVLMAKEEDGTYTIEDVIRTRALIGDIEQLIIDTAKQDGSSVVVSIPQDPGIAGVSYAKGLASKIIEKARVSVILNKASKSKVLRFRPFASIAQLGKVKYLRAHWNDMYFTELEDFTVIKNSKDDCVDATSDAFDYLAKELCIPDFSLPDMKEIM